MTDPAYVSIAGEYARKIRSGELPPGIQLPSYAEIATRHGVSDIVVRKALDLLQGQGLVRSVRRRGIFVTDRPNLVRISPERQMETAEATFGNESAQQVQVDRETGSVPATDTLAEVFGVVVGDELTHIVTRVSEDGRPISISDTYQPPTVSGISAATDLEEAIADQLPAPDHAKWLETTPGDLVKTVSQRFMAADGRVVMISNISYPRNRYDSFVFRMKLSPTT
nr:GntR family transcriptional regulator [Kibdelosporangium sp. MJ126-NF4]CEL21314.1 Transcriptional regulator, GntR family [Kibdelosporangium sp. MJ126-NF4]CTQ96119.1 Transcriptional regulator, GntR family [Kibdelosporangium sp. MJ126-NF4]